MDENGAKNTKIYLASDPKIHDNYARIGLRAYFLSKKNTNMFKHTNSVLRDNAAQMGLQTLNIYEKKAKYINIRLAFCASMPHG